MKDNLPIDLLKAVVLLMICLHAQSQTGRSQKVTPQKRIVTLETVLSCVDDPLIVEVFKTDAVTARFKLNAVSMIMEKHGKAPDTNYTDLRFKGFVTATTDESHVDIMPTDLLSGNIIPSTKLPFCHDRPTAYYQKPDSKSHPDTVIISGEDWFLNPNEVFSHADQFQFESGTFTNSSEVYLSATKGRASIQFIAKPEGLRFYRVLYSPSE